MRFDVLRSLKDAPARLPRQLSRRARAARGEGEVRIWRAQTQALERVGAWLERSPGKLGPLSEVVERLVDRRLDALTSLPIAGYEGLNAKEATRAIRDLADRVPVLVVQRYEEAHKKRKTVLRAIEEQLERLASADGADGAEVTSEPSPA